MCVLILCITPRTDLHLAADGSGSCRSGFYRHTGLHSQHHHHQEHDPHCRHLQECHPAEIPRRYEGALSRQPGMLTHIGCSLLLAGYVNP